MTAARPPVEGAGILLQYAQSTLQICHAVHTILDRFAAELPADPHGLILLKPNLNANMIALTGNTTDLRLLVALIEDLQHRGYTNILIGEGTNSGFYRHRIDVLSLLRVRAVAELYGVRIQDFNYSASTPIFFTDDIIAEVAQECFDAACFINLPKFKTHAETGMSVCMKNLVGCLVGQENKKKVHQDLPANIVKLNAQVRPHIHIVDGLVAMEGLGPTRGVPRPMHLLAAGTDPLALDYVCARIADIPTRKIRTVDLALRQGLLASEKRRHLNNLDIESWNQHFLPAKPNPLAATINHPRVQKYFLALRNTPVFTYLAGTDWFGHILVRLQLRQDVFMREAPQCLPLTLDHTRCDECGLCADFCPLGLYPAQELRNSTCLHCLDCLYCFMVCPHEALQVHGTLGFMAENVRRYAPHTRRFIDARR